LIWLTEVTHWLTVRFAPWQTLLAGLLAIVAAVIAVGGAEFFARRRANREIDEIRLALAVEIRSLLIVLIEIHGILTLMEIPSPDILKVATEVPKPTVYPATADRIGTLGPLAADVTAFYGLLEWVRVRMNIGASVFGPNPSRDWPTEVKRLAGVFEQACRTSLPLLSKLPLDPGDAEIKTKVEAMGKRDHDNQPLAG
jgi:hypothetical protein